MNFLYSTLKGAILVLLTVSICKIIDVVYSHFSKKSYHEEDSNSSVDFYDFISMSILYLTHQGYTKLKSLNNDFIFISPNNDINHVSFVRNANLNENYIYSILGLMIKENVSLGMILVDGSIDDNIYKLCDTINEKGDYKISLLSGNKVLYPLTIKTS